MSTVNVYLQRPNASIAGEPPLQRAGLLAGPGPATAGVILRERGLLGHLLLRGDASDDAFASALNEVLGVELPGALTVVAEGELSLQWLAPDEWLLIVPGGEELAYERRLRAALGADLHYSVVNVSGGQTLLELSGPHVRDLLMKSTPYDVHPRNFPPGKAVGSVFAKSQCLIRRTGEDTWELLIRRSFSDYFSLWLRDAAAEYGLWVRA
ncbi:sarcosine oxidase subunit gamma [Stutzerimonas kirkiae]|uniref:Sarcosine oxidase subunit gamma n=1 Tax=Stutzerimonas kirkiae TaxID=2211392 RepID=A0A4Q9RG71_9GAMM|nr:sarcosine oxidase subunit gamma family protein [Stutzerimonas kirkiae]TBU99875.1 sarcosine oxidase subunit gamma [Stutzerimonas kirkiae]TBV05342.1 sarcosine oxidase subunit gamma [Stutzerimonas kirkiae]TBV08151.1 sarcosine oxidase subunit gamma [Stutzerimonas kirkiae]TBV17627.1 sarcosine oxidase subunit gamma [Stutzerimonas kirkiae]